MLVVCNGMIRAGSTLQYNLVRGILEAAGVGAGWGSFEHGEDSKEDLAHSISSDSIVAAKTHGIPPSMPPLLQSHHPGLRVCYVYRDLRDVAVSARHKFGFTGDRLVLQLDREVQAYNVMRTFHDHPHVLRQRYEDTIGDLTRAVRQCADFLRVAVDDETVARIVHDASITKAKSVMKRVRNEIEADLLKLPPASVREARREMRSRDMLAFDRKTQLHWNHISPNEGRSGTWREHLTESDVATIETRYREWFDDAGYPVG